MLRKTFKWFVKRVYLRAKVGHKYNCLAANQFLSVTEEENKIIEKRVAAQRKHFEEYEKRERKKQLQKIFTVHPYLSEEEVLVALKHCKNNEVPYTDRLTIVTFSDRQKQ
jgi:hypothetical protein